MSFSSDNTDLYTQPRYFGIGLDVSERYPGSTHRMYVKASLDKVSEAEIIYTVHDSETSFRLVHETGGWDFYFEPDTVYLPKGIKWVVYEIPDGGEIPMSFRAEEHQDSDKNVPVPQIMLIHLYHYIATLAETTRQGIYGNKTADGTPDTERAVSDPAS